MEWLKNPADIMLQTAAVLIFLLGLAHSVLGERFILMRLFRRVQLPVLFGGTAFTVQTLRFAWHLTTVFWWGLAALFWQAARAPLTEQTTLVVLGSTFVIAALLPLVFTRGRHLSWLVLLTIGGLLLYTAR